MPLFGLAGLEKRLQFVRVNKLGETELTGEGPIPHPLDEVDPFALKVGVPTRQRLRTYPVLGPCRREGVQPVDSAPIDGPRCSHFEEVHDEVPVVGWVVTAGFALHWVFGGNAAQVPVADLNRVLLDVSLLLVGASGCPFVADSSRAWICPFGGDSGCPFVDGA